MGDGAGLSWPVKKNELRGKRKPIDVTFVMWAHPARPLIERGARRSHMVDETLPASGDAGQACVARRRQVAAPLLDDGLSDVRDPHGDGAGLRFDIGESTAATIQTTCHKRNGDRRSGPVRCVRPATNRWQDRCAGAGGSMSPVSR
jgi:hypothetical protein